MPQVSIIIPVYHVENYLRQCIESVMNQTLKDIEIILIDNGASDIERVIIEEYEKSDNRIKVIHFEENQGYGKAVNTGIKSAAAPYVGIVESDDYIDAGMFETLYNLIDKYNADIAKSAYRAFTPEKTKERLTKLKIPTDKCFKLSEHPEFLSEHPSIWSCLYRKDFLLKNGIFFLEKQGTSWVDNPFQLESLYKASKIIFTDKIYYNYRDIRPNSSSTLKKALKVPYLSVMDMQNVIKKYNITDSGIIYNLALRIMSYIKITLDRADYSDIKEIKPLINELFEQTDESLKDNPRYKKLRRRFYRKPLAGYFIFKKLKDFMSGKNRNFC